MIAVLLAVGAGLLLHPQDLSLAPETVCKPPAAMQTSFAAEPTLLYRPQDRAVARPQKLGELPKPNLELAVLRSVGGCAAPVVVSTRVEGDGRFAEGGK